MSESNRERVQRNYYQKKHQLVDKNYLNRAYKDQALLGDTLLIGGGLGLSWYAAKQLVERAYRKRLHHALLDDTGVKDTYENRITPVENEFVTDESSENFKYAARGELKVSPRAAEQAVHTENARDFVADQKTTHYILDPHQSPRTALAVEMAKNPAVSHSLAFASIPALFALATWGANEGAKKLFGKVVDDTVQPQIAEKQKARQEYEAAARMLRSVSQGDLEKEGSLQKEAVFPLVPLLWGLGGGAAATAGGTYLYNKYKQGRPGAIEDTSPELNDNKTINSLMNLGLSLGALALLYPGYKFVQSLRKGYNDKAESVSDAQVALQAWNAQRQAREDDFATLRAALAEEPDLLQKYFNSDGTLKSNPQIT